MIIRNTCSVSY